MLKIEEEVGALRQELAEEEQKIDELQTQYPKKIEKCKQRLAEINKELFPAALLTFLLNNDDSELRQLLEEKAQLEETVSNWEFLRSSAGMDAARSRYLAPLHHNLGPKDRSLRTYLSYKDKVLHPEKYGRTYQWQDYKDRLLYTAKQCGADAEAEAEAIIESKQKEGGQNG